MPGYTTKKGGQLGDVKVKNPRKWAGVKGDGTKDCRPGRSNSPSYAKTPSSGTIGSDQPGKGPDY
jgi:hypothetical protein